MHRLVVEICTDDMWLIWQARREVLEWYMLICLGEVEEDGLVEGLDTEDRKRRASC